MRLCVSACVRTNDSGLAVVLVDECICVMMLLPLLLFLLLVLVLG